MINPEKQVENVTALSPKDTARIKRLLAGDGIVAFQLPHLIVEVRHGTPAWTIQIRKFAARDWSGPEGIQYQGVFCPDLTFESGSSVGITMSPIGVKTLERFPNYLSRCTAVNKIDPQKN